MAKVNFSFDTTTKKISVDIDGRILDGVESVSVYKDCCGYDCDDSEKFMLSLSIKPSKIDGMRVYTHVSAAKTPEGEALIKDGGILSKDKEYVFLPKKD